MLNKACKNVLVRGVNWVGDAVMTLPALRALRKALPEARISLLVKPWVSPLFEQDPHVDETIIYGDEYQGIMGKIKIAGMLRKRGFVAPSCFKMPLMRPLFHFSRESRRESDTTGMPEVFF